MPANWTTFDDDLVTGDQVAVTIAELEQRTLELRACFIGPTEPTGAVDGSIWIYTGATPWEIRAKVKVDAGAASWQKVGPLSRIPGDLNGDPDYATDGRAVLFQLKGLRFENRAAHPAVAPGNAGFPWYRTADGEVFYADQPVSGAVKGLLSILDEGAFSMDTQELSLAGNVGNDATNPPTQVRSGVLEGWLFDNTNEKRTLMFVVPKNWRGGQSPKVRLHQVLEIDEADGDVIEWTGEWRSLVPGADKVSKTATAFADSLKNIGADVEGTDAGGGPHVNELVLVHNDATNPIAAGNLVLVTIWRKTVGGAGLVSGTILFRADLVYAQKARHERA